MLLQMALFRSVLWLRSIPLCVCVCVCVCMCMRVFSSVAHLYPTPCDPLDCSMPGFPVYHQLYMYVCVCVCV